MNPLVSICIPTYNGASFIKEALNSAMAQTYSNIEIVVSDDASSDTTLQIVEKYLETTTIPIRVYHHQPNGIGSNWNHCIKHAHGKYIKFLFQDDILKPTCIDDMVQVLEANKSIALVASKREFIVEASYLNEETEKWIKGYGNLQEALQLPLKNGMRILDRQLFKSDLFLCSPLNKVGEPSVTLFRKDLLKKTGYFREDLKQILDYEFYYRILKKYEIAILEKELVKFRLHQQQATNINKGHDSSDYIAYDRIIYKEYFKFLSKEKQIEYLKKYNPFVKKYYLAVKLLLKIKRRLGL